MTLADIVIVAEEMLVAFGADAPKVVDARASSHAVAGEAEGLEFWSQVARAVRACQRDRRH